MLLKAPTTRTGTDNVEMIIINNFEIVELSWVELPLIQWNFEIIIRIIIEERRMLFETRKWKKSGK